MEVAEVSYGREAGYSEDCSTTQPALPKMQSGDNDDLARSAWNVQGSKNGLLVWEL